MFKFFTLLLALAPTTGLAHVKWFATAEKEVPAYHFYDKPVLLWIFLTIVIITLGYYLDKKLKSPKWLTVFKEKWAPEALSLASIGFGISFLIFSLNGFIFAPNLLPHGNFGILLLYLQGLLGIMILLGLYERIGGFLIFVLFALSVKEFGVVEMMDTLEMLGFAFYATILGRPKWKITDTKAFNNLFHKMHSYAVPVLRVGTGLNLVILGFSEKILTPSLTDNFLSKYDWNFMQNMGFENFSNYWFGFSAGGVEIILGLMLVFGFVTRLTTLVLAVFLLITLSLLGPIELIGHLPHFSIAIVLLLLGAGTKFRVNKDAD